MIDFKLIIKMFAFLVILVAKLAVDKDFNLVLHVMQTILEIKQ